MRFRSVLMLASVAMILAATGIGNAFANTWSGTDQSNMNNGNLWWYSYVSTSPVPTVAPNTDLTWENGFYNVGTNSYWPFLYYKTDNDDAYGRDPNGPQLGQYGYWWPDTATLNAEGTSGSHHADVEHWWGESQGYYSMVKTYDQPYTVS